MPRLDTQRIREELPATSATVYLNTGSWGPLPRRSASAIYAAATRELEAGRISGGTSQEHMGVLIPLAMLGRRHGVKITFADVGHGGADRALDAFEKAIHPGVKMVVLSHVLYTTGATLPLKEITEMAHAAGSIVHVDGAQTVGAIPVDVHDLGIDQYAFPGQKWLCGPDCSGGFFVREDQIDALSPTFMSFSSIDFRQFDGADPATFVLNRDCTRFETGTFYRPAIQGFASSVEWLQDVVDFDDAIADIASLSAYCRNRASEIPGVTVLTPPEQHAGLVSFQIGDADVDRAVAYLAASGISIRNVHENNALRISTGYYNTTHEVDLALDTVREFIKDHAS